MNKVDWAGLSGKAKVGMGILVAGMIIGLSGCLNLVGLAFKGLDFLDAVLGESPVIKIAVGMPLLVVGGVLFRWGGGKEYFDRQRAGVK